MIDDDIRAMIEALKCNGYEYSSYNLYLPGCWATYDAATRTTTWYNSDGTQLSLDEVAALHPELLAETASDRA